MKDYSISPFSLHDALGYLIPGLAILFVGSQIFFAFDLSTFDPFQLFYASSEDNSAINYVVLLVASYVAGHVVAYISAITVERYSIWALGYPSKSLLGLTDGHTYFSIWDFVRRNAKSTTRGMPSLRSVVRLIRVLFEDAWRLLVLFLCAPFSFPEILIGRVFGLRRIYCKRLDSNMCGIVRKKLLALMHNVGWVDSDDKIDLAQNDYFTLAYHYCLEYSPAHVPKFQNYVALYGFMRALTAVFTISFWAASITFLRNLPTSASDGIVSGPTANDLFSLSALATLCFLSFQKFYQRYSHEALMALCVVDMSKHNGEAS